MAALQSPGPEVPHPQGMTVIPVENLVPPDTQLITPALAEAFELPYNLTGSETGRETQGKELQGDFGSKDFAGKDAGSKEFGQGAAQMPQQQAAGMMQQTAAMKQPENFAYQVCLSFSPLLGDAFMH